MAGAGRVKRGDAEGAVEWAVTWVEDPGDDESENVKSFCNAIPTPDGGTHEAGLKTALTKGLKAYGELKNDRRAALIAAEDVAGTAFNLQRLGGALELDSRSHPGPPDLIVAVEQQ